MEQDIQLGSTPEDLLLDLGSDTAAIDVPDGAFIPRTPALHELPPPGAGLLGAATWQLVVKRGLDILVSALAIVILAPLLLVVALLVKITSRGPVFYVQQRVGRSGEPFRMIKFRSMYQDAHDRRDEHLLDNMHEGPIFKIRDDPRITSIGRTIRRASIDELPQLFNVLMGNMSLVGPRPPLPEEFLDYTDRERAR